MKTNGSHHDIVPEIGFEFRTGSKILRREEHLASS
jgi:hypothetical protein